MDNLMTTWLDVVTIIPNYFDWNTGRFQNFTKGKVLKFIKDAQSVIESELRPYYGNNLDINIARLYSECLLSNSNPDFILNHSGITITSNFTQIYTIAFVEQVQGDISTTKFEVRPDTGDVIIGTTTVALTLPQLTLGTSCWGTETFIVGDKVFLSVQHYETLLSILCAKLAAAYILEQTANSQLSTDGPNAQNLKSEVMEMLKSVKDPFAELLLIKQMAQDTNPVAVHYDIDKYGTDNTIYIEG